MICPRSRLESCLVLTIFASVVVLLSVHPRGVAAQCLSIPIQNAGFEADVLGDGEFALVASSWSIDADGVGTFNPTVSSFPGEAPEGQNVLFVTPGRSASQVLPDTLAADKRYTVSVKVGNRLEQTFLGYAVELYAGDQLLASDLNTLGPAAGTFATSTFSFSALPTHPQIGQSLEIRVRGGGGSGQVIFDGVQVCATDLAPTDLSMLGRLVMSHDTNTLATDCASETSDVLAVNIARWLIQGQGSILAVEPESMNSQHDFSTDVQQALANAGYSVTYTSDRTALAEMTASSLSTYDALFLGVVRDRQNVYLSSTIPGSEVVEYIKSGGNVYIYGGALDSPEVEAELLNPVISNFGARYVDSTYNGISGVPVDSPHPAFSMIAPGTTVCNGNGQSLVIAEGGPADAIQGASGQVAYAAFAREGRIVVVGDEWPLSDTAFSQNSEAAGFAGNISGRFGGGDYLIVEDAPFVDPYGASLTAELLALGQTSTTGSAPCTTDGLAPYDAVFLSGMACSGLSNMKELAQYLLCGGNIYLALGTAAFGSGNAGALAERDAWAPLMGAAGLGAAAVLSPSAGLAEYAVVNNDHPLAAGLTQLTWNSGQEVFELDPSHPETDTAIELDFGAEGVAGAIVVPEPRHWVALVAGAGLLLWLAVRRETRLERRRCA